MTILLVALISAGYNIVHYQVIKTMYRSRLFMIIEILRVNVMAMITFYYLQMASEQILDKKYYKCTYCLLFITYFTLMGYMVDGWL